MYQVYCITILATDRGKAEDVLIRHAHDIDDITISRGIQKNAEGIGEVTFWIKPYIHEDIETIRNEFLDAGIQLL